MGVRDVTDAGEKPASGRDRRRATHGVKDSLRGLAAELSALDRQVAARAQVRDGDLTCLDIVVQAGPLSPGELARRTGLRPATVTGVLDRLERDGWVERTRGTDDRRAVVVRAVPGRVREVFGLYGGMSDRLDEILDDYPVEQLAVIAGFLARAQDAGVLACAALASEGGRAPSPRSSAPDGS